MSGTIFLLIIVKYCNSSITNCHLIKNVWKLNFIYFYSSKWESKFGLKTSQIISYHLLNKKCCNFKTKSNPKLFLITFDRVVIKAGYFQGFILTSVHCLVNHIFLYIFIYWGRPGLEAAEADEATAGAALVAAGAVGARWYIKGKLQQNH